MDASTLLATFAQVSIGFLGFTALVSVLSAREWDSLLITLRLWMLIEFSLGALMLSLFPFVLSQWDLAEPVVWRISSFASLMLFAIHGGIFLPRIAQLRLAGEWPGVPPAFSRPMEVSLAIWLISQLLTLVGLLPPRGGYLAGLFVLTFITGLNFATMLFVLRGVRAAPS